MQDINDHLTHQRWLLDNGLINDLHKDNLFVYGTIVHKEIQAVQVDIDVEKKQVRYDVYITGGLIKKIALFDRLQNSTGIIALWRLRNLVRNEGNLNFHSVLNKFVKDYCGPKWNADVKVKNIEEYEEGFKQQAKNDRPADKPVDQ